MGINYLAVIICAVASVAIGFVWYSKKVFGSVWGAYMGMNMDMTPEQMAEAKKRMPPLVIGQIILSFIQAWALSIFVFNYSLAASLIIALIIYVGFLIPMIGNFFLWGAPKAKGLAWKAFFVSAAYQLVSMAVFVLILSAFR